MDYQLLQRGIILSEILMIVCVHDGIIRIRDSQVARACLPINIIVGVCHNIEVTHFMDEGASLRVGANQWSKPEDSAKVNVVWLVGIYICVIVLLAFAVKVHSGVVPGV